MKHILLVVLILLDENQIKLVVPEALTLSNATYRQ